MRLSDIQRRLGAVMRGASDQELEAVVRPAGRLSPAEALAVYRDGYLARLSDALAENFTAVHRVLGDEDFFRTAREFIAGHNSSSHDLSAYHPAFPEFLRGRDSDFPFLPDLARFEWLFREVFHLSPGPALHAAGLAAANLENARLLFGKGFRVFESEYAVWDIWKRRNEETSAGDFDWERREQLVLYIHGVDVYIHPLSAVEARLLGSLRAGQSVGSALEHLESSLSPGAEELDAAVVRDFFRFLAQSGIIEDLEYI